MHRGLAQVAWIGALYGTTTFLPISRGGHLALGEMLFDTGRTAACLQLGFLVGTLFATVLLVRQSVGELSLGLWRALCRPSTLSTSPASRELLTIALAQIPVAAMWLLFGDAEDKLCRQPMAAAVGFFLTTLILLSTAWAEQGEQVQLTWVQSLLLGFGQALAVLPGLSMTGCTIAIALWFGLTKRRSFELAMLVSLPVMLLASVRMPAVASDSEVPLVAVLLGTVVTLLTGLMAGKLLRTAVVRGRIAWFSMWVAPLAIATFAFARAWPTR